MASVQSPPRARTQDVLLAYDLLPERSDNSPGKSPTKVSGIEDSYSSDQNAGILTPAGAYFAVVVAAFGGVSVKTGRRTMARMHPWSILILVVPLFVIQITMIVALVLDMDVTQGVWDFSEENEKRRTRLVVLKCLMIFVVNMVCFGHMLSNIRFIVFITNPITWLEIRHPSAKQWLAERWVANDEVKEDINLKWRMDNLSWLYHPFILWLACIISLIMRYCVSYFVMVNSMSIIFASQDMTAAIFNSLALTFVNELNTIYWDFLTSILNLEKLEELNSMQERTATVEGLRAIRKQFKGCWPCSDYTSRVQRASTVINELGQDDRQVRCACFVAHIVTLFPYLSRGNGYRRFENFLAFLMLGLIYLQQVYIMCFALMTNVLPVARDICTMWRWSEGRAHVWKRLAPILINFLDFVTLVHMDLDGEVSGMPRGACRIDEVDKQGHALDAAGMYYRMLHSDRYTMTFGGDYIFVNATLDTDGKTYIVDPVHRHGSPYKSALWFGLVCLVLMVIVPQFSALRDRWSRFTRALCGSGPKVSSNDAIAPQKSSDNMISTDVIALQNAFKDLEGLFRAQSLSVIQLTERVKELESKAAKR